MIRTPIYSKVSGFAAGLSALLLWGNAPAQAQPPAAPPADIVKIYANLGELDLLAALLPAKITPEQAGKLLEPMKAAAKTAEENQKAEYDALRPLAADVEKARSEALKGTVLSAELEAKINKVISTSDARYAAARKEAVAKIFAVAKSEFNDEQKTAVREQVKKMNNGKELVPRQYAAAPSKAPKDVMQDIALNFWVERILVNDRAIALLGKMKETVAPPTVSPPAAAPPVTAPPPGRP